MYVMCLDGWWYFVYACADLDFRELNEVLRDMDPRLRRQMDELSESESEWEGVPDLDEEILDEQRLPFLNSRF